MRVLRTCARRAAASQAGSIRRVSTDRGALSLFLVILVPGLLAFAGLVVDAGTKLNDYQNAAGYAQEAARAGAEQINVPQAYSDSTFVINPQQAVAAADAYLATLPAGVTGSATPIGDTEVQVTVHVTSPTKILSIIGIPTVSAQSTATATLLVGGNGPGT